MRRFELRLNGQKHQVEAEGEMPLLWVLRDLVGLTGTKYGCGAGICGACTVLFDDRAVRSCRVSVEGAIGHEVTTIEGLSDDGSHPVQQAWLQAEVSQCGYCQTGVMMEVVALLRSNPGPSPEETDRALQGHLCRCGSYSRIRQAAVELAAAKAER